MLLLPLSGTGRGGGRTFSSCFLKSFRGIEIVFPRKIRILLAVIFPRKILLFFPSPPYLCGDCPVLVLVEHVECGLEGLQLVRAQFVSHPGLERKRMLEGEESRPSVRRKSPPSSVRTTKA